MVPTSIPNWQACLLTDNDKLLLDQMATQGGNTKVVKWIARYCSRPFCAKAG